MFEIDCDDVSLHNKNAVEMKCKEIDTLCRKIYGGSNVNEF